MCGWSYSRGEDVEVIIVNDGSTDGTHAIAQSHAEEYPDTVKVIDKGNGGHILGLILKNQ